MWGSYVGICLLAMTVIHRRWRVVVISRRLLNGYIRREGERGVVLLYSETRGLAA